MSKYDVYSEFDLEKHKATYTNYLEVLIDESGEVMYAVPSHQEKAIQIACEKLEISREELKQMCPRKYWCDFMKWLCLITGVVAVWNDTCVCGNHATKAQAATLRRLKLAGVYKGPLPPTKYVLPADLTAEILAAGYEIEHDDDGCYRFGRYSPAGQDFGFTIDPGGSIMDLIHALYEYWDAYDVSYETFIWLDSSGHKPTAKRIKSQVDAWIESRGEQSLQRIVVKIGTAQSIKNDGTWLVVYELQKGPTPTQDHVSDS